MSVTAFTAPNDAVDNNEYKEKEKEKRVMYQAIVIACLIGTSAGQREQCTFLEAQKWHDTERACMSHAFVLAERVHTHIRGYKAVGGSCKPLPKGVLSR